MRRLPPPLHALQPGYATCCYQESPWERSTCCRHWCGPAGIPQPSCACDSKSQPPARAKISQRVVKPSGQLLAKAYLQDISGMLKCSENCASDWLRKSYLRRGMLKSAQLTLRFEELTPSCAARSFGPIHFPSPPPPTKPPRCRPCPPRRATCSFRAQCPP